MRDFLVEFPEEGVDSSTATPAFEEELVLGSVSRVRKGETRIANEIDFRNRKSVVGFLPTSRIIIFTHNHR